MLMNMKTLLSVAQKNHFAVPAFNISDYSMFLAVMKACEEENAPVIIEIHPHELSFIGNEVTEAIKAYANRTSIPVVLHLDHGSSYEECINAMRCGFTSVMIDSSSTSFEENVRVTKEVVKAAHAIGVSVEAELGTIGVTTSVEAMQNQTILYTKKEDALKFTKETDVDTLAIAIGTSHGLYPKGMTPKLRLDILQEIRATIDNPLVLHGGSGNADDEIAEAVKIGVCKINISSDVKSAYFNKMREVLQDPKLLEPNKIEPKCMEAMAEVVKHKVRLFNDNNKAGLYSEVQLRVSSPTLVSGEVL